MYKVPKSQTASLIWGAGGREEGCKVIKLFSLEPCVMEPGIPQRHLHKASDGVLNMNFHRNLQFTFKRFPPAGT